MFAAPQKDGQVTKTILGVPVKAAPQARERVLDTVVDLTDRSGSRPARSRPKSPADDDHTRVAELVSNGTRVGAAVVQVAAAGGKTPTSVQNNYYRVKRRLDGTSRAGASPRAAAPRVKRRTSTRRGTAPPAGAGSDLRSGSSRSEIEATTAELIRTTAALTRAARGQATELAALRAKVKAIRGELA